MATATEFSKEIVLKYADKGSFRFNKIALTANDQQLYDLANALNMFQTDAAEKVIKVTTKLVV
jgi:hypothetical protein